MIQVQRIEGESFETKEQAEQHGIELCKEWIDKQKPEFNRRVGGVNLIFLIGGFLRPGCTRHLEM